MNVATAWQHLHAVVDAIAPARCMGCLRETTWLCDQCRQRFVQPAPTCIVCAKERPRGLTCADCVSSTPLTGVVSVGPYGSTLLRRGIHWMKFNGVQSTAEPLARLLSERLQAISPLARLRDGAALVPVPLHARRLRNRGFNQSAALASALSALTGIPVFDGVVRQRMTWTQTRLPKELRSDNVSDAFAVIDSLPDRPTWLVVDDVTTSGATLSAVGDVLKKAGAHTIWGVTVARG